VAEVASTSFCYYVRAPFRHASGCLWPPAAADIGLNSSGLKKNAAATYFWAQFKQPQLGDECNIQLLLSFISGFSGLNATWRQMQ
jgi:hypothetical protein